MRYITLAILGLNLLSCASKDFNEPGVVSVSDRSTRKSYSGSYSDVYRAMTSALSVKKYPVASATREGGLIVTDWVTGKSDRLFSGFGDTRIPYNIRFKFTIKLQPSRNGVNISIQNEEQYLTDAITAGTDFGGSLYQWVPTDSSTAKEAALLDEVANQLTLIRTGAANK